MSDHAHDEQTGTEQTGTEQTGAEETGTEKTDAGQMPSTEQLQEPSTEKEPEEEPKAAHPHDPEPDHQAVGIGVVGGPQTSPDDDEVTDGDPSREAQQGPGSEAETR